MSSTSPNRRKAPKAPAVSLEQRAENAITELKNLRAEFLKSAASATHSVLVLRQASRNFQSAQHKERDRFKKLSRRERQVLELIAEGNSTKQIALKLGVSFKTAVTHRTNLLAKTGAHEAVTLVRAAIRAGIINP